MIIENADRYTKQDISAKQKCLREFDPARGNLVNDINLLIFTDFG
jgi:hypothetical protein